MQEVIASNDLLQRKYFPATQVIHLLGSLPTVHYPFSQLGSHSELFI